jgi:hypothetical protein
MNPKRKLKSINVRNLSESITVDDVKNTPNFKDLIYEELFISIEEGMALNKKVTTLFELNHSGCILELSSEYWAGSLKEAVEYFEKKEKYEKCSEYNNLINKVNEYTSGLKQNDTSGGSNIKRKNVSKKKKENKLDTK